MFKSKNAINRTLTFVPVKAIYIVCVNENPVSEIFGHLL